MYVTYESLIQLCIFIVTLVGVCHQNLQKKALLSKAIFNTYFAIRTPEEKYDERARI